MADWLVRVGLLREHAALPLVNQCADEFIPILIDSGHWLPSELNGKTIWIEQNPEWRAHSFEDHGIPSPNMDL